MVTPDGNISNDARPSSSACWPPLASSPSCLNALASDLGLDTSRYCFVDVWGLDEASLEPLNPCHALILVYPTACEDYWKKFSSVHNNTRHFFRQTVGGTCGTLAVLHALANSSLEFSDQSLLARLCKKGQWSPSLLEEVGRAQVRSAAATHTKAGECGQRQGRHFVTFVPQGTQLVLLNGRREEGPIAIPTNGLLSNNGGFLKTAASEIGKFFATGSSGSFFSLLALVEK